LHRGAYFDTENLHPEYHRLIRETIHSLAAEKHADILYVDGLVTSQYVESTRELPAFINSRPSRSRGVSCASPILRTDQPM
jgi:Ni,Fe-hydrogenase III small subunit